MFVRKPVICETDEFAQSTYHSIININSDFESGKSGRLLLITDLMILKAI